MSQTAFPNRLLFTVTALCPYLADPPRSPEQWPGQSLLPALAELDGEETFARVQVGWNEEGLYVAATVPKTGPLAGNRQRPASGDSLHLWVDVQPGAGPRGLSGYCHCFIALPAVPGSSKPLIWEQRLRGRRGTVPRADPQDLGVQVFREAKSYTLLVHLPGRALSDFCPRAGERVGFEYLLTDTAAGRQTWATSPHLFPVAQPYRGPDDGGFLLLTRE